MNRHVRLRPQGVLLLLCGAALLRIALFGELYLRYVKEGLRPLTVTGTWHPMGEPGSDTARPVPDAVTVKRTTAPSDPYEKR
ncbi:hypothetical protein [Streptomyces beigongshangae]|uniref:hypothetical protein n=1 Tax=Streptomyces beigongshangae TaxID=2841597 RepID=UPI003D318710